MMNHVHVVIVEMAEKMDQNEDSYVAFKLDIEVDGKKWTVSLRNIWFKILGMEKI